VRKRAMLGIMTRSAEPSEPDSTAPILCCRMLTPSFETCAHSVGGSGRRRGSFLTRPGWDAFRVTVASLREYCPAAKPVVIRTAWLPITILGECIRRRERFVVRLNRDMDEPMAVETLCHEWAHALAWNYSLDRLSKMPGVDPAAFDRACHDEAWGCAYSRVWRAYLEVGG